MCACLFLCISCGYPENYHFTELGVPLDGGHNFNPPSTHDQDCMNNPSFGHEEEEEYWGF